MVAFGKLPFQFQQRGDVLAEAVAKQDHKVLSQHLTKRDQDLEDYLATLKGARVSAAVYNLSAPATVPAGAGGISMSLDFAFGIQGLEHADSTGFVPLDSSNPYAGLCIVVGVFVWVTDGSSTAGIGQCGTGSTTDTIIYDGINGISFFQTDTSTSVLPASTPIPTWTAGATLIDQDLGILFSGGTLHGLTEMQVSSGSITIYVVD